MEYRTIEALTKLNIGCGNDIRPDYVNLDVAALPGVDVVTDLEQYPWNLPDDRFEEVIMINVLEHLTNTIAAMEELWRVSKHDGKVIIRVPYWNSLHWAGDPTHKTRFSQYSMNFFDPTTKQGAERPYYSKARFKIDKISYWRPLRPLKETGWVKISNPLLKRLMDVFALYLGNIIWVLEFELIAVKESNPTK